MQQPNRFKLFIFSSGLLISTALAFALTACAAQAPSTATVTPWDPSKATESDFLVLYPGVYEERVKDAIDGYYALAKSYRDQKPLDVQALVSGKLTKEEFPGFVATIVVDEDMVRYTNDKYDPDNRVLNDSAYARSLGYDDIVAYISLFANDDTLLLRQPNASRDRHLTTDLNHEITYLHPIYPGDTLYVYITGADIFDLTPPAGSTRRWMAIESRADIYNQDGVKVQTVKFRTTRGLRLWADESHVVENATMQDVWDAPDWMSRPLHVYTDADWDFIKGIWAKEHHQGAAPLYWEDVDVGDEPAWTADGPVFMSVQPQMPWGSGVSGSKTLRHEIMDPENSGVTLVREEDTGNYTTADPANHVLPTPGKTIRPMPPPAAATKDGDIQSADLHQQKAHQRSILINYMGRDYAIRHINNFMGDHGWLENIRWSIMDPAAFQTYAGHDNIPQFQRSPRYLSLVPAMKGKHVNIHGLTNELAIVKSYVYDKYVRNGTDHVVELAWWIENIEGDIWEEGAATVLLPSRSD